ncbi:hypothetical protein FSP39_002404 [Pinctada imbricata]|uniref:B box-type domain-containing protein n=1 Tax=Pinctada imbricata TaxID=66713 RepID=A0AA88XJ04_PINIB|nr:hypothetical protein FSP39_002404 [Pinctada imbricata]
MALSKSINLLHAQRAVPCDICEDEIPGKYYCIECKQTLCPQCEKNHKRVAGTKHHNIVLRTQVGDIDNTTFTCTDHGNQASFHCEKCNIAVCTKCVTGKHRGHNLSDLDDIWESEKKIFHDDVKALQRAISTLETQRGEILTEKENYKKKTKKILKNIDDENQAAMEELQRIHKERVNKVHSIQNSHLAIFDGFDKEMKTKIISFENRISEYEEMIKKKNLPALRKITQGKYSLLEIGKRPELPYPPTVEPGDLQLITEKLRKLLVNPSPLMSKSLKITTLTVASKFKCPLEGFPRICITKEDDVWLGGFESRELVMVDIKGRVTRRRKIQNRTNSLAVMDCGDVIISPRSADSKSVSRLPRDGKEQHVFDTSPSISAGVSVTPDQKILICAVDGRVVKTNVGFNVKEIYNGPGKNYIIQAVENREGNIYITDWDNQSLVKTSEDGKVLSTITHTTEGQQLGRPHGLVVDKMDNVLCTDTENDCVYIIDQNQQISELVGRSQGIQSPHWLAVDNDNNLWITQEDGTVQIVKYVTP